MAESAGQTSPNPGPKTQVLISPSSPGELTPTSRASTSIITVPITVLTISQIASGARRKLYSGFMLPSSCAPERPELLADRLNTRCVLLVHLVKQRPQRG